LWNLPVESARMNGFELRGVDMPLNMT
jgi:hypothetical protein